MTQRLAGKRIAITQADDFMGPATIELFEKEGAEMIADTADPRDPGMAAALVERAGEIDALVINLAAPNFYGTPVTELAEDDFALCFDIMVHPLHRLVKAAAPQMMERKRGKIIVYGSAVPMRAMPRLAAYTAARSAQVGYVSSAGVELAKFNIQVNLIAQNWVENPDYYPPKMQENPKFQANLKNEVPLGRLAKPWEDAAFALFLASEESDFFVGQSIPFSGGWAR